MKSEKLSMLLVKLITTVEEAAPKTTNRRKSVWRKRSIVTLITACLVLSISITAYAIEVKRYNAAVDYLAFLGIEVADLSNYSRSEIEQAVTVLEAGETNELSRKILSSAENSNIIVETPIAQVSSKQIRELTPQMMREDIINTLGKTRDIGSGIYILVYEVDGTYLLNIPLAGNDAQLGVTGEQLLDTLTPQE